MNFVKQVLQILYNKGDIYPDTYEGWYCTPCESFWSPSQAKNGLCPDCHRPVERLKENNFFFRLSKYQDWLINYIQDNPDFIKPDFRLNEVVSFLKNNKLSDLCISRPKERLSWGIELPFSKEHVCYVWFDALLNYISAVGKFDSQGNYYSVWWPADLHLIGKDILRQHAIYWPIILHSLGIKPPRMIFAHGWWLVGKDKISKSRGNIVDPENIIEKFGVDTFRYFLLRDVPFGLDGSFSEESFVKRLNSDLANDLGNLVYRVLSMIEKYFAGSIPSANLEILKEPLEKKILEKLNFLEQEISLNLKGRDLDFSSALEKIWELINMANKYIEEKKPWNLFKENRSEELKAFLSLLIVIIKSVKDKIYPFMPQTSQKIQMQVEGGIVKKSTPLFSRIEE
ncbi:MAG: methionine--tRNA ligase [Candidatus Omnitrophica bacterium]|nr:methionine--tRNA ligase [Candidatus Omnitrophota bacterium]